MMGDQKNKLPTKHILKKKKRSQIIELDFLSSLES